MVRKVNVFIYKEDSLNILQDFKSRKSQYVIPRSFAPGITLTLSSYVDFIAATGLKAAP